MKIESFKGEYRFLSNYWPVEVDFEGAKYPSVEQAYKAAKTIDLQARAEIAGFTPNSKELGAKMDERIARAGIRADWDDDMRLRIMLDLVTQKFDGRSPELRQCLIETGDAELVEGNDWGDVFFGVSDGIGTNHLGKILMEVRNKILTEQRSHK